MRRILALGLLLAGAITPAAAQDNSAPPSAADVHWLPPARTAVLQMLDKITGRVRTIDAPIEQTVRFGALSITAHTCRKRPPEEPPESAAFLEIRETKPGEAPRGVFSGWMYASSPAVSALENPVYDVWVLDCKAQ